EARGEPFLGDASCLGVVVQPVPEPRVECGCDREDVRVVDVERGRRVEHDDEDVHRDTSATAKRGRACDTRSRSANALRVTTAPSTNSDAMPSCSPQLPMSPESPGSPVVRLRTYPIATLTASPPAAAHARGSPRCTSASPTTTQPRMSATYIQPRYGTS